MAELIASVKYFKPAQGSRTAVSLARASHAEDKEIASMVREMRQDHQITLIETVLKSYAKQVPVTVTSEGDARARELADSLTDLWWNKLAAMLDCFAYGRVAFEKVWGYQNGLTLIGDLSELPFENTRMILDPDGSYGGVKLSIKGREDITLSADESWWLALDPSPLEPHGKSRYAGALHKLTCNKRWAMSRIEDFIEKFVYGAGVIHGPNVVDDPDNEGEFKSGAEFAQEAWRAGRAGGIMYFDNDRLTGENGQPTDQYVWDAERLEFQVRDGRPILDIIDAYDGWQLLAVGFPPKTIMEGDAVGSFALVSKQMLFVLSVVEDVVGQAAESFNRNVVQPCVQANFVNPPEVSVDWTSLTDQPDDLASKLVESWLTSPQLSPLLSQIDLRAMFDAAGIPVSKGTADDLQARVAAAVAQPLTMGASWLPTVWR